MPRKSAEERAIERHKKAIDRRAAAIYNFIEKKEDIGSFILGRIASGLNINLDTETSREDSEELVLSAYRIAYRVAEQEAKSERIFSEDEINSRLRRSAIEFERQKLHGQHRLI